MMIEDAREFLKNLAADGLDAYIDRVWQMREPVAPKPSSKTGWPIMSESARMDYEGRLGLMPHKGLKVLK
jgi:hypothetical protein